jgi:hypothetical protein
MLKTASQRPHPSTRDLLGAWILFGAEGSRAESLHSAHQREEGVVCRFTGVRASPPDGRPGGLQLTQDYAGQGTASWLLDGERASADRRPRMRILKNQDSTPDTVVQMHAHVPRLVSRPSVN